MGTEIWFRTDKKCGRTDGQKDGRTEWTDGRTDDAKTISLRLRRGIIIHKVGTALEMFITNVEFGNIARCSSKLDELKNVNSIG